MPPPPGVRRSEHFFPDKNVVGYDVGKVFSLTLNMQLFSDKHGLPDVFLFARLAGSMTGDAGRDDFLVIARDRRAEFCMAQSYFNMEIK